MYTLCIDWFIRQEIITTSKANSRKPESFSLGLSNKLSKSQVDEVMRYLEDGNIKLQQIRDELEKYDSPSNVIDAYIKRSRLSRFEKFQESYWKEQFLKENG